MTITLLNIWSEVKWSEVKWKSLSCVQLCDPTDCSPSGSSVHGILQARILEWVAISFSRGSSRPRNWTWVSCIAGRFFTDWAQGSPNILNTHLINFPWNQIFTLRIWWSVDTIFNRGHSSINTKILQVYVKAVFS